MEPTQFGTKNSFVRGTRNLSVVISMSLVLFMLAVLGLLLLNMQRLSEYVKESFTISVYLDRNAERLKIEELRSSIKVKEFTKKSVFISKNSAAQEFEKQIGENFLSTIGDNPLSHSIDIQLKSDFVSPLNMRSIEEKIKENPIVTDVIYDRSLMEQLFNNAKKLSIWILILSLMFLMISIVLINNSIRLAIYSKRFLIRTQQMVGATRSFIWKPFLKNSIILGTIASFIAMGLLTIFALQFDRELGYNIKIVRWDQLGILYLTIFVFGLIISALSAYFATQRYLKFKTEDLY